MSVLKEEAQRSRDEAEKARLQLNDSELSKALGLPHKSGTKDASSDSEEAPATPKSARAPAVVAHPFPQPPSGGMYLDGAPPSSKRALIWVMQARTLHVRQGVRRLQHRMPSHPAAPRKANPLARSRFLLRRKRALRERRRTGKAASLAPAQGARVPRLVALGYSPGLHRREGRTPNPQRWVHPAEGRAAILR